MFKKLKHVPVVNYLKNVIVVLYFKNAHPNV